MSQYVAFLRGINVGGNKKVPMKKLIKVLEKSGFKNVKTLLISGNAVFEVSQKNAEKKLSVQLAKVLLDSFGFEIPVVVLPLSVIQKIMEQNIFKKIKITPKIRLYVTFFMSGSIAKNQIKIPYQSPDRSFQILKRTSTAVFSFLDLSKNSTPKAMEVLEKEFGKQVTTRNYNTLLKLVALK